MNTGIARTLPLVVLDLARFTSNKHMDVVVSNERIRCRRGIGLSSIKANIKLLLKMKVLRREDPSPDRLKQLKKMKGGFSSRRRYLVWNPQSKWRVPEGEQAMRAIAKEWNQYHRRSAKDESSPVH